MRFEARDLKPDLERVKAADLVAGRCYFRVGFIDEDMVVPDLESLVFIGRDLHPVGPGLYFQDWTSTPSAKTLASSTSSAPSNA